MNSKGVKLIWEEGKDEWAPYALAHMEAIRAKYFPKNVKGAASDKSKGMVEKALPSAKTVDHLADAAATNAPAGPLKVCPETCALMHSVGLPTRVLVGG